MKREPLLVAAPFSGTRVQTYQGTKRYLSTGDLQNDSISFEDVTYEGRPSRADICVEVEDVLFARMKSTRKVLFIDEELQNIIVSTGFAILRPEKNVSAKYLVTYLKSDEFERQKEKYCSGSIQPAITNNGIQKLTIPLPPLDDQKRIAHLLGKVEGMIYRRKQHLQQLDELLKSVFLEMFGDPVRNEKGWEKLPINCFSDSRLGKMRDKKFITGANLRKYLGNSNVQWFRFVFDELLEMDFDEREREIFKLEDGDLLVCEGGDIGRCAIWRNQVEDCYFQKALHRIRFENDKALPEYIQYVFLFYSIYNGFKITSKATIAHLTGEKLKATKVPLPPITLQNQFTNIVEKVESLKSRYQASLSNLENFYGALSQKAFKGELDLGRVPLPVEEKTAKPEEVPMLPFDEGLSETMKKTLADLNKFNNSSASLRALQEAASINFNSSAMEAVKILAEQARLWKNPLDELKNMSSVARAMEELAKPSAGQQIAKEQLEAFQHTSKLAQQLASSIPKIDTSFIEQQKKLIESASRPFMEMQKTLANLNLTRTTLSGVLDDSEAVARRFQTAIPDYASWQQQYSAPEGIDTESEEEEEPKHIFTRYDILDALEATEELAFEDLSVKLTELESIDLSSYERIRNILFDLLSEGILKQQFDEESQSLKLRLAE